MVRRGSIDSGSGSVRDAAADIFVLCFPLFLTDAVRRAHPMALSQFHLLSADAESVAPGLLEDDSRVVISSAWIDLSEGPVVTRLPHMHGRYFSLTVVDMAGDPFVCLGTRTGDDTGLDLVLCGPNWMGEIRRGLRAKRAPSDWCWAITRIHAHSTLDRTETVAITKRQCLSPLGREGELTRAADTIVAPIPSSLRQVGEIDPNLFFHRLETLLERAPQGFQRSNAAQLTALRDRLGGPPRSSEWTPEFAEELARGFINGMSAIRATAETLLSAQGSGWRAQNGHDSNDASSALIRAAHAYTSLGAPAREELLTLICDHDEADRLLWGRNSYRLTFTPEALPPVHGFWRLYTRPAAPSDQRHGLGNRNDLLVNSDGSLDLTIQNPLPDAADIANWLPAPEGEFSLVMRLYSPRPAALTGAWRMPPVQRIDPGSEASRTSRRRTTSRSSRTPPPAGDTASQSSDSRTPA